MGAAGVGDEGPRPVGQFGDDLGDRKGEPSAEHRGDGGASPVGEPAAAGGEEDQRQGGDEERLGGVDVEEQRVLDGVVPGEEVIQRVQQRPVHRRHNFITRS